MKTAVITDSNSGIFGEEARRMGIHVIPMPVIIDDVTYFENEDITHAAFFEAQQAGKNVSSSQPSPASIMDVWELVLENADDLVYIPMSSGLSGSCQTARALAEDYDGRVQVADNHRISVSMRQSVERALKLADRGMNAEEIKNALEEEAYKSTIFLTVETLSYFKKTGRITPAAAMLGEMLNIKPVLITRGEKFDTHSKVRGLEKARAAVIEAALKERQTAFAEYADKDLYIGAAGSFTSEEDCENWYRRVHDAFPNSHIYYDMLSLSVTCHTGPNAAGVGISLSPDL